jgi:hypothetical protein
MTDKTVERIASACHERVVDWFHNGGTDDLDLGPTIAEALTRQAQVSDEPRKHDFWGAGEPDCPRDIKAGNGEIRKLRCKVCGKDNPLDDRCLGGQVSDDAVVAAKELIFDACNNSEDGAVSFTIDEANRLLAAIERGRLALSATNSEAVSGLKNAARNVVRYYDPEREDIASSVVRELEEALAKLGSRAP